MMAMGSNAKRKDRNSDTVRLSDFGSDRSRTAQNCNDSLDDRNVRPLSQDGFRANDSVKK